MKRHLVLAFALLICAVANLATAQQLITPVKAGLVNSPIDVVNINPGDQTDPHISGNLVAYTDASSGSGLIRYFNFLTGADTIVPGDFDRIDTLSSIDGTRIVFSRQLRDRNAIFLYDTATSSLTEIDPQPGSARFATAIGGSRVAFVDASVGSNDILLHDLLTHTTVNLSANNEKIDTLPNVAPDGNTVMWDSCNVSFTVCEVYAAHWQAQPPAWFVAPVSKRVCNPDVRACIPIPAGLALNPDTDGSWIVYDVFIIDSSTNNSSGHIVFQPIAGDGIERHLVIAGRSRLPRIVAGVIAFEHRQSPSTTSDIFVYQIATNRLYQITDTPLFNEILSDVTVLPNGDIRVAWAADDAIDGATNIYATTFAPASVGSGPDTAVIRLMSLLSSTVGLKQGQINSLTDKLSNVLASIDQGSYKQAINQMTAFIHEVEAAVRARKMSVETAAPLLAAARDIIKALS